MAGYRFWLQCSLSFVAALTIVQPGWSQPDGPPKKLEQFVYPVTQPGSTSASMATCKVYALADLGDDPKLCAWVAETIPHMIAPGSWTDSKAKLSYYAPGKVMVINHTGEVHAQVDAFLTSLKKSLPARRDPQVMQAQFVPDARPLAPPTAAQAYPVPYPPTTPKHLFHFIIRYEGEGIIDENVVKFAKALAQEAVKAQSNNCAPVVPSTHYLKETPSYPVSPFGTAPAPSGFTPAGSTAPLPAASPIRAMPPADPPPLSGPVVPPPPLPF
ncbi:MAG: hypothetical protein HY289_09535 [Planctomycetes bacterium]|nr:hypothetical protein [Planctomycetota bacterium]